MLKVTVKFHKTLQKFTNGCKEHSFIVDSYMEIIKACVSLFPKFERFIESIAVGRTKNQEICIVVNNKVLELDQVMMIPKPNADIVIVPIIAGAGKNVMLFVGIAILLIAVAIIAAPLVGIGVAAATPEMIAAGAAAGLSFGQVAGLVFGVALTLVTSLLAPKPKAETQTQTADTSQRRNNDAFEGLSNTSRAGTPVQLNYGLIRVAGQFISGYIKTLNHGESDIITVSEQFA